MLKLKQVYHESSVLHQFATKFWELDVDFVVYKNQQYQKDTNQINQTNNAPKNLNLFIFFNLFSNKNLKETLILNTLIIQNTIEITYLIIKRNKMSSFSFFFTCIKIIISNK